MEIKWLNDLDIRPTSDQMIALICVDGSHAYVASLEEGFEHSRLLKMITGSDDNVDNYYRIIFDEYSADWIFNCPKSYKLILDENERIRAFYDEGMAIIKKFLELVDCSCLRVSFSDGAMTLII